MGIKYLEPFSPYLQRCQGYLKEAFFNSCGNDKNCYLTPEDRALVLKNKDCDDYIKYFDFYSIAEGVSKSTAGEKEDIGSIANLKLGWREVNKTYIKDVTSTEKIDMESINLLLEKYS